MAVEFVVSHHVQGRNQPSQGMKILGHFFGFPAMSPAKSSVGFVGSLTPPPYFIACRMGNRNDFHFEEPRKKRLPNHGIQGKECLESEKTLHLCKRNVDYSPKICGNVLYRILTYNGYLNSMIDFLFSVRLCL